MIHKRKLSQIVHFLPSFKKKLVGALSWILCFLFMVLSTGHVHMCITRVSYHWSSCLSKNCTGVLVEQAEFAQSMVLCWHIYFQAYNNLAFKLRSGNCTVIQKLQSPNSWTCNFISKNWDTLIEQSAILTVQSCKYSDKAFTKNIVTYKGSNYKLVQIP